MSWFQIMTIHIWALLSKYVINLKQQIPALLLVHLLFNITSEFYLWNTTDLQLGIPWCITFYKRECVERQIIVYPKPFVFYNFQNYFKVHWNTCASSVGQTDLYKKKLLNPRRLIVKTTLKYFMTYDVIYVVEICVRGTGITARNHETLNDSNRTLAPKRISEYVCISSPWSSDSDYKVGTNQMFAVNI